MAVLKHYYFRFSALISAYSLWLVLLLHAVGIVGMLSPWQEYFRLLTPFNLIFCGALLWLNHRDQKSELIRFAAFVFLFGYIIEFVGVHTGLVFGRYSYGATLGPTLFGVPIIIGLNWLLITYSVSVLTDGFKIPLAAKIILGALLAVGIDWLIEPVAVHYDFWSWTHGYVPLRNYVGWFFTSLIMLTSYHVLGVKSENKLALPLYLTQLIFFLVLTLSIRL